MLPLCSHTHTHTVCAQIMAFVWVNSKEPKIRARMAKTTEELVKQCMENAKRERERRERGQSELEHLELDSKPMVKPVEI